MTQVSFPESHLDILENEMQAMLSTIRHKDGLISTNPVMFDWDGEFIRISSLKQRVKYKNLLTNPSITFCVVSSKDPTRYIEVRGHAELIDDDDSSIFLGFWKKQTGMDEFPFDDDNAQRVVIKIIPEQISSPLLYGGKLSAK